MSDKDRLLSIGEMSKLTGAGIRALRHYEKINILKPAFVDKSTGYRHYKFSQTYVVELIRFAVELDIPLKELTKYVDEEGTMDFGAFVTRGSQVVRDKMKTLERALKFFDFFEEKLALEKQHDLNQIYSRNLPQKTFYTIPYEKTFDDVDKHEVAKLFLGVPYDETSESDGGWVEYGFLSEHTAKGIERYVFVEVTQDTLMDNPCFRRKIIPSGKYFCRQKHENQIEQAAEIFKERLAHKDNFVAIETEVFFGKFNVNKPVNELRVIML